MRRISAFVLFAVAATPGGVFAQSDGAGLYLYRIPSERANGEVRASDDTVFLDLYVTDPDSLIESLATSSRIDVVSVVEGMVRVRLMGSANDLGEPADTYSEATFVVDYDQASIEKLSKQLRSRYGSTLSIADMVDFVDQQIGVKSHRHGFAVASQIARNLEGDCTEHAVLVSAMARAQGRPARLVFGVLVLIDGDDVQSFGHAWSEIYDGQRWHIADATRPDRALSTARIHYLPLFTMHDEGPGYAMELMKLTMVQPSRIVLVSEYAPDESGLSN